jgi:hypothetical protein
MAEHSVTKNTLRKHSSFSEFPHREKLVFVFCRSCTELMNDYSAEIT